MSARSAKPSDSGLSLLATAIDGVEGAGNASTSAHAPKSSTPAPMGKEKETTKEETADDANSTKFNIKLVNQSGDPIHFKIKHSTKMSKIMAAYAERMGIQTTSLRFLFDGQRFNADQTAKDLELEDGDSIDVMTEQQGGTASFVMDMPMVRRHANFQEAMSCSKMLKG
mgnify:CR=1 FL=1